MSFLSTMRLSQSFERFRASHLGKDILITLVSQFLIMVLALIVNKLLSNYLGVEGYGQYSIIKKSTSVLSFVMLGGMGIALPRYLSFHLGAHEVGKARAYVVGAVLMVAMISVAVLLVAVWQQPRWSTLMVGAKSPALYHAALVYAVSLTASSLLLAYYRGLMRS
jgi:O-antigen/teichoic acid export membrane protein